MIDQSLLNKKIVIYGSGRYPLDFLYIFDQLDVIYQIDDNAGENTRPFSALEEEQEDVFVIVCKYDPVAAHRKLDALGLQYGKDYCNASDLFYLLDYPLREKIGGRKLYIWGIGTYSHTFFHSYIEHHPDLPITGCIDSNILMQGKTFFRYPVFTPYEIENQLIAKNAFVIVATARYYDEVKATLQAYGLVENEDFVCFDKVHNYASFMMKEVVNDIPKIDFVCERFFKDGISAITADKGMCMCMWVRPPYTPKFMLGDTFYESWHGTIAKILRLSAINGTYSFCDKSICRYFKNAPEPPFIDVKEYHYHYSNVLSDKDISYHAQKRTLPKDTVFNESNYLLKELEWPEEISFAHDYTCNLHCGSCRENVVAIAGPELKYLEEINAYLIQHVLPHISRIKLAGLGEVFASRIYQRILFDTNTAQSVKNVNILTNGTLFSPDQWDKVESLYEGKIKVLVSVDGTTKETVEKLRRGANFNLLMRNLDYLGKKRKEGKLHFLAFNFVVQRDNFREMPGFVRMAFEHNADKVKFSRVINWRWSKEKYDEQNMFDEHINPNSELANVIADPIFKDERVHLFRNLRW